METSFAVTDGANEIDIVLNIGEFLDEDWQNVDLGLEAIQEVEAQIEEAKAKNEVEDDDFDVDDIFEEEVEEVAAEEAEEAIAEAEEAAAEGCTVHHTIRLYPEQLVFRILGIDYGT